MPYCKRFRTFILNFSWPLVRTACFVIVFSSNRQIQGSTGGVPLPHFPTKMLHFRWVFGMSATDRHRSRVQNPWNPLSAPSLFQIPGSAIGGCPIAICPLLHHTFEFKTYYRASSSKMHFIMVWLKIANAIDANDTCLKIISQYHEKAYMVQKWIDKGKPLNHTFCRFFLFFAFSHYIQILCHPYYVHCKNWLIMSIVIRLKTIK